jgi:hypothetical protein
MKIKKQPETEAGEAVAPKKKKAKTNTNVLPLFAKKGEAADGDAPPKKKKKKAKPVEEAEPVVAEVEVVESKKAKAKKAKAEKPEAPEPKVKAEKAPRKPRASKPKAGRGGTFNRWEAWLTRALAARAGQRFTVAELAEMIKPVVEKHSGPEDVIRVVRNSLRRPVRLGWIDLEERGKYAASTRAKTLVDRMADMAAWREDAGLTVESAAALVSLEPERLEEAEGGGAPLDPAEVHTLLSVYSVSYEKAFPNG